MSPRLLTIAAPAALLLLLLGGCGGGDDGGDGTTPAQQTGTPAAPVQRAEGQGATGTETPRADTGTGGARSPSSPPADDSPPPTKITPPGTPPARSEGEPRQQAKLTASQRRAAKKFFEFNALKACQTLGVEEIARTAGTTSRDPEKVAAVYADRFAERTRRFARDPTYEGCLAGFRAAEKK